MRHVVMKEIPHDDGSTQITSRSLEQFYASKGAPAGGRVQIFHGAYAYVHNAIVFAAVKLFLFTVRTYIIAGYMALPKLGSDYIFSATQ